VKPPDDSTVEAGTAGMTSNRLTALLADWGSIETPKPPPTMEFRPPSRTDPISHVGGPPDAQTTGIRPFSCKGKSTVPMTHKSFPDSLSPEEVEARSASLTKQKEVPIQGGAILYNVSGFGDMLPAATKEYFRTELPTTQAHRIENDKRELPHWLSKRLPLKVLHPLSDESPEMRSAIYGGYGAR